MIFEERVDALTTTTDYCWVPSGNNAASSVSPWTTCQKQQVQQHARANTATTCAMEAASSATIRRKRTQCEEEGTAGIRRPRRRRRRSVHHGVDELRRALLLHPMTKIQPREQEVATSVATTNDAEASRSLGDLSCLHDSLLLDVLAFCCARDLARIETSCRFARRPNPGLGGRSACEHVAWIQLQQKEVDSPKLSLRGSMQRLHLASSRVLLTVLRRRSRTDQQRHNLAAIGAASAIARNLTAPIAMMTTAEQLDDSSSRSSSSSRTRRLRETDVSSDVVRVRDGIFADASLFHRENGQEEEDDDVERIDVPFEYAKAIGLSMRNTDAALAVGDCVVDSMPDITPVSRVRPDGCWVLRTVNGNPCWSPETYRRTLDEAADDRDEDESSSPSNLSTTNANTTATTTTTSKKVDDGDFAQVFNAHLEAGLDAKALVRERLALEEVAAATARETKKHPRNSRRRPPPSVRLEFEHAYDRQELALPLAVSASTAVELARAAFLDSPERLPRQPDGTTAVLFATDEPSSPGRTACWTDADRGTTLADYGLHAGNHVTFLLHFLPEMHANSTPPQG